MSYEGRNAYICENGHVQIVPENYGSGVTPDEMPCPNCKSSVRYVGAIDDTNCTAWADFSFEELTPLKTEKCPTCGHTHTTAWPTYKVITYPEDHPLHHGGHFIDESMQIVSEADFEYMQMLWQGYDEITGSIRDANPINLSEDAFAAYMRLSIGKVLDNVKIYHEVLDTPEYKVRLVEALVDYVRTHPMLLQKNVKDWDLTIPV